jgi:ABC-2 type transport system permease protein
MKRIISIFKRDALVATRDFVLLYIIIAPILLALLLSVFAPDVADSSVIFVIDKTIDQAEVDKLADIGHVINVNSRDEIVSRVNESDDVYGLVKSDNDYEIVLEGNEAGNIEGLMKLVVSYLNSEKSNWFKYKISSIDFKLPPVVSIGTATLIITSIILGGMVIGLNIVEDKEFSTIMALNTSPLNKIEYVLGKSILGIILPILHTPIVLKIMKLNGLNLAQLASIVAISSLFTIFYGLMIGMISSNQLSAIATAKGMMFILAGSILGAIVLKDSLHYFLYWSPLYWIYQAIYKIIAGVSTWGYIWLSSGAITLITLILFVILSKYQKKYNTL